MKKITVFSAVLLLFAFQAAASEYADAVTRAVERLVNAERTKAGLAPFKRSAKLPAISLAHSRDMATRSYIAHINPEGLDPSARAKKAGYNIVKKRGNTIRTGVGENLYEHQSVMRDEKGERPYLESAQKVAQAAVKGWMSSPGHRKNILNPDYGYFGTGVAVSKDKKIKITQMFF